MTPNFAAYMPSPWPQIRHHQTLNPTADVEKSRKAYSIHVVDRLWPMGYPGILSRLWGIPYSIYSRGGYNSSLRPRPYPYCSKDPFSGGPRLSSRQSPPLPCGAGGAANTAAHAAGHACTARGLTPGMHRDHKDILYRGFLREHLGAKLP